MECLYVRAIHSLIPSFSDFYVTSECHDITDAVIKNSEKDAICVKPQSNSCLTAGATCLLNLTILVSRKR